MIAHTQEDLFEPTGAEVAQLALDHAEKAMKARKRADALMARGWSSAARFEVRNAEFHDEYAEALGMLADFERLGGVTA